MKTTFAAFAVSLLAGTVCMQPVHAQTAPQRSNTMSQTGTMPQAPSYGSTGAQPGTATQLPQGSFRSSCNDLRMEDQTLIAFCPKGDEPGRRRPSDRSASAPATSRT